MHISIKATHIELTDAIKNYAEEKTAGLAKYIDAMEAKVELERATKHQSGEVFRAEINLVVGGKMMHADATAEDLYAAIDLVIPKIKEQAHRFKDKKQTMERRGARSAKKRN